MKVRLTRKFADMINGIDLSKARAGQMLDLPAHEANMLMAEGWAEYESRTSVLDKADERRRPKRMPRREKKCETPGPSTAESKKE